MSRPRPTILYHYTSFSAFYSIMESQEIWASDIGFLNDIKEFRHGVDTAKKYVSDLSTDALRSKVVRDSLAPIIAKALDTDMFKGTGTFHVCVASFSEVPDVLSQWRGYCPDGRGVCIGFKTDNLLHHISDDALSCLEPCEYDPDSQKALIEESLANLVKFADEPFTTAETDALVKEVSSAMKVSEEAAREAADKAMKSLTESSYQRFISEHTSALQRVFQLCALLKDRAFQEEREWRLVIPASSKQRQFGAYRWGFRATKSMLVPYLGLALRNSLREPLVLDSVIVGPSPDQELAVTSLKRYFEISESITCQNVVASGIPYKNW